MGAAPSKTPAEILKENKNAIRTSVREIDREVRQINRRKTEVEAKIKKAAKESRVNEVKIFAKDLIRIKKAIEKFEVAKANLQGIQIQLQSVSGNEAIRSAMKGATAAYKSLNGLMDPQAMQRIMAEYEKEGMRQEMMSEMMEGSMDDAMGSLNDAEAEDELVEKVLSEIGVEMAGGLQGAPVNTNTVSMPASSSTLNDRLNNLCHCLLLLNSIYMCLKIKQK